MIYLSKAQLYFDDLVSQGYPENEALDYTQKYYPGFFIRHSDSKKVIDVANSDSISPTINSPYIPSNSEDSFVKKYGPKAKIALDSTMTNARILLDKLPLNRKTVVIASTISVILILSAIAFLIPTSEQPINGTWVKSDGQKLTFDSDGDYDDQSSFDSIWKLNEKYLTIISSGTIYYSDGSREFIEVIQEIEIYFSDDENALWLDIFSVKLNGDEQNSNQESQCVLVMKNNIASDILEYSNEYSQYLEQSPKQCQ
tara:strand:+ start:4887 stop:5654 length:768 start_codon:yes stop_codon:yes gene_type:complete